MAISSERCATNQQINTIIPNKDIDCKYLYNTLSLFKYRIISRAAKSVVPILNKGDFSLIKLPVLEREKRLSFVKMAEKFEDSINSLKIKLTALKPFKKA